MRQNAPNIAAFVVLAAAATGLWWYADRNWIPKPEPAAKTEVPQPASADAVAAAAGGAVAHAPPKLAPPAPKVEPKAPAAPTEPPTLITLGGDGFNNRVTLTTQGAGVQQVILPAFDEADRIGHEVKEDGKPVPLHLIPGEKRVRGEKLKEDFVVPHLPPGKVNDPALRGRLAEPAYTLFHYASPDDKHPDPHLGTVNWRVVEESRPADGPHTVAFEAVLGEPFFVKVRKSYTLAPKDYHIGLRLEFSRTDTGGKAARPFRYQLSGPRGLPVEGEWYTSTTRTALVGYDNRNRPRRQYEDAASINTKRGGEALHAGNGENQFRYIAIATPYFASALAVDRSADPKANPWAYVRATSELPFLPPPEERAKIEQEAKAGNPAAIDQLLRIRAIENRTLPELDDITIRAVSEALSPEAGQPVVHTYIIYNGPSKVRLLNLLGGDAAVDSAIVDRYLNDFQLKTITDFQSPTVFGTFANAIYWTDLVVTFTNLMHGGLWAIHKAVAWLPGGSWGYSIIILTVLVRLLLFFPSRKQTAMNMKMVEVQKRLKPELDKLKEKYGDDFRTYNQEKTRLMLKHGMNPFAAMGGCLLLFAQMPIFMGLYFCLQESVFFRVQSFLWVENLAAPDMTVWWTENVPLISDPSNRHGTWSFLYLGPYLNVLPLLAVGLMLYQQNKMMPEPTDEQMAAQQRMMKIMMGVMAVLFYKVAAGLSLYFIVSTGWGIIERQFIPKPKVKIDDVDGGDGGDGGNGGRGGPPVPPKPKGFLGRFKARLQARLEEMQKQAAEQSSRQHRNAPPGGRPQPIRNPERRDGGGKDRKKKRK